MPKCLKCNTGLKPQLSDKYPFFCPKCMTAYGAWIGKKLRDANGNLNQHLINAKDSTRNYLRGL